MGERKWDGGGEGGGGEGWMRVVKRSFEGGMGLVKKVR